MAVRGVIINTNDDFVGTPEERWAFVHAWVKEKLDAPGE